MSKIFSSLMVLAVIILIILGLNTSSQGISSLTAEDKKPVVGLKIENQKIDVIALGEQHDISRQDIIQAGYGTLHELQLQCESLFHYLKKIWKIFEVLFLKYNAKS